jgi:hypothetical protein
MLIIFVDVDVAEAALQIREKRLLINLFQIVKNKK